MRLIEPSFEIFPQIDGTPIDGMAVLKHLERCGRTAYKSEDQITPDSAIKFMKGIIKRGHESVVEHYYVTFRWICDRGVTHELVRHRLASYTQESTRYCDYSEDADIIYDTELLDSLGLEVSVGIEPGLVTYILPGWSQILPSIYTEFPDDSRVLSDDDGAVIVEEGEQVSQDQGDIVWFRTMAFIEESYLRLRELGWKPQQARSVLPNSLKTDIVCTMNLRELRHFFKLRTHHTAHPQMRELAIPMLRKLQGMIPVIFADIEVKDND